MDASMLQPAATQSQAIAGLWHLMLWVCGVVYALVIVAVIAAVVRGHRRRLAERGAQPGDRGAVIGQAETAGHELAGVGVELDVIAACFIGGASASGGVGKITGAVIGAFIMGVMNNGMSIMGLSIDYQQLVKGLVLLAAVYFDVYNKKKG